MEEPTQDWRRALRPIRAGEEALVHALIAACYREFGLVLNLDDGCEAHMRDPGAYFRAHGGEFWVVADDRGVVRATVAMVVHDEGGGRAAELKSLYVGSAWRRRGVGRWLTLHVIGEARRAGCVALVLWSDTRFGPAHRLYESMGFARFGRRDIEDSNASSEWGYRMELSARP